MESSEEKKMNENKIQPSINDQLSTIFDMMDKIITYESDVCGLDNSTLDKYMEISKLIYAVLEKNQ